jgi:thiosulfate/3-mercaptopyruvate sulfurtransferase
MFTTLIEPPELAAHVGGAAAGAPPWVIIDCRFELSDPEWGAQAFAAGHIPGAQYAHTDRHLSGSHGPLTGRHPLPSPAALAATFGGFGIGATTQVVAYDQGPGTYAARLWWLLRWLGHRGVAVLNGGFAAWERADLPVSRTLTAPAPVRFSPRPADDMLVTTATLESALGTGALERGEPLLVDARSAERFAGHNETLDPVAGHIPGARNHPFAGNLDSDGRFLAPAELRRRWLATLGARAPAALVIMCGSGITACHNLLALESADLPGARLYAGSWSEWIRDPRRAVARGAAPV